MTVGPARAGRIDVAVVARAGAPTTACLAALAEAGVRAPRVVVAGVDGPGLSGARNAALAACDGEVLALVEDDVVVAPGWLGALEAAWSAADGVGTLGGPIRAGFPGGRPGWLTDATLAAFALQDLGPEPRAVPVTEATFHGGNLSLRADALRAVGGFWPVAGHPDGRDWFSEEHHAQRELAAAGWSAAWVPAAAAQRRVPPDLRPRALLWRRLRYGARDTLVGSRRPAATAARTALTAAAGAALATIPRPAADAARTTPTATAGAALATIPRPAADAARTASTATAGAARDEVPRPPGSARAEPPTPQSLAGPERPAPPAGAGPENGDAPGVWVGGSLRAPSAHPWRLAAPGLAVERAARAAENVGALLGPWLAHADVQPGVRATPFQHTVPPPAPGPLQAARRRLGGRARAAGGRPATAPAMILIYHRVAALEHDPLGLAVAPEHFAAHLDVLRARGDHRTLAEVAAGAPGIAITLDDGYLDNLTAAAPALRAHGLTATLFVATGPVAAGGAFWWDVLDRALRTAPPDAGPLRLDGAAAAPPHAATPHAATPLTAAARPHAALPPAGTARPGASAPPTAAARPHAALPPTAAARPGASAPPAGAAPPPPVAGRGGGATSRTWPARTRDERRVAFVQAHRWLQGQPPAVQARAVEQACAWAGTTPAPAAAERLVTPAQLVTLDDVFDLGAHTVTHRSLGQAPPAEQRAELARSGDDLARWTGRHPTACSYPYGVPGVDVTHATLSAARALGYAVGVVNAPSVLTSRTDRLALPRHTPPPAADADAFAAWLGAVHPQGCTRTS